MENLRLQWGIGLGDLIGCVIYMLFEENDFT